MGASSFGDFSHYDLIGILGVALYLGSYAALQFGLMRGRGYAYAAVNAAAAGCVLLSLVQDFNLSSALIQVSWITISIIGISRLYLLSRRVRFNAEEAAFLQSKLPRLVKHEARRLLDIGHWANCEAGTVLIREGECVPYLVYLVAGEATVAMNGHVIAASPAGAFLGELTCLTGEPATATVTAAGPARCLMIEAAALRRLIANEDDIRQAIDETFAGDARDKLIMANRALIDSRQVPA